MLQLVLNSIIKASAYLESLQLKNGSWSPSTKGEPCCYYSAQAIYALAQVRSPIEPNLVKAVDFLCNNVNHDNGWGRYEMPGKSDVFATSSCLVAMKKIGRSVETINKAQDWIIKHQNEDDGYGYSGQKNSTVKGTAHALFTLGMFDNFPSETINRCLGFLRSVQQEEGGWGNLPGEPSRASCTAMVAEAISEYGWQSRFGERWPDVITWLLKSKTGKLWPDIVLHYDVEGTTCALNTLLNLGYSTTHNLIQEPLEYIIEMQTDNGAFPLGEAKKEEDIGSTADVTRTLSKWLLKYVAENPYIVVEELENLAQVGYNIQTKPETTLKKLGEEHSRLFEISLPHFFRVSWGKVEHLGIQEKR